MGLFEKGSNNVKQKGQSQVTLGNFLTYVNAYQAYIFHINVGGFILICHILARLHQAKEIFRNFLFFWQILSILDKLLLKIEDILSLDKNEKLKEFYEANEDFFISHKDTIKNVYNIGNKQ